MEYHSVQPRFEFKYLVGEAQAKAIRCSLTGLLVPDEHADQGTHEYPVHSMYLDSPGLDLFHASVHGEKNRVKLRARFYSDRPEDPVMIEIKRRETDVILKQRVMTSRQVATSLLEGRWPTSSDLAENGAAQHLESFCRIRDRLSARPKILVSYIREAYVLPHDISVRVTFDRYLRAAPYAGRLRPEGLSIVPLQGVVLEIKFSGAHPGWMSGLIRRFHLERKSVCKYVISLDSVRRLLPAWGIQPGGDA
jgi:hypothetical protein